MRHISPLGILAGMIALIVIDGILGDTGLPLIFSDNSIAMHDNTLFLILRTLVGIIALIAGGYITAKIAKASYYLNAGVVGLLSVLITMLAYNGGYPLWFNIIGFLFLIPAALLGGHLVKKGEASKSP